MSLKFIQELKEGGRTSLKTRILRFAQDDGICFHEFQTQDTRDGCNSGRAVYWASLRRGFASAAIFSLAFARSRK
jgi:hypothetical protein